MKLKAYGEELECAKAVKGADWIKLYDEAGICIASFSGISDFAGYTLSGGEFEAPEKTAFEILQETVDQLVLDSLGV